MPPKPNDTGTARPRIVIVGAGPVGLAMAESNNDFAQHELDEGNYHDARRLAGIAVRPWATGAR